jgi:hypothetical protein
MTTAAASLAFLGTSEARRSEFNRRELIVTARWALIFGCAYLILFGQAGLQPASLAVIAILLGSNVLLGRLPMKQVGQPGFALCIATADTVLIGLSLYLAGQVDVELLVLFLGVLILAIAGLPLWGIAVATLGMGVIYLAMVWGASGALVWQWSTLLRPPFLLGAALAYASLVESCKGEQARREIDTVAHELLLQLEAIRRCRMALASGADGAVDAALQEIERRNFRPPDLPRVTS